VDMKSGRITMYEDRKRELIRQLDFQQDVERMHDQIELWTLKPRVSTMLLLKYCGESTWRRAGVA
jgi:hypothetical protein